MSGALANHLPVVPVLLPAFTAIALLLLGDHGGTPQGGHGHRRLRWARWLSLASVTLGLLVAVQLARAAAAGELMAYPLGHWPAPFGIVLVVDRLAAWMLVLSACVALPVLLYASGGWDAHGRHFHALFQFQLMGLNGAFLTGDLFNLFVFFEVLLIASYVLLLHGQGRERFRVGIAYVALNLLGSALFLVGAALVYASTGTLNFAELALRVPQLGAADAALLQVAAGVLLVVFGFKAALVPLGLWLPATYAAACAPVAALFSIMTKVGVYAILRFHGVILGPEAGASALLMQPWLLPLALATSVLGVLGALAAHTLPRLVAWLTVVSVGTILAALGLFSAAAWSATLYYLAHSTLVIAGLFMLVELVAAQRGDAAERLVPGSAVAQPALLGLLMLMAAGSVAGLPPLPGFIGKLMLLQSASGHPWQVAVWSVVLGVGFLTLLGLARAGSILFWSVGGEPVAASAGASPRLLMATIAPLLAGVALSFCAEPLKRYTDATALQLLDREAYGRAVLGTAPAPTLRPYRGEPAGAGR
ncbi:monovalent cation/H+ antiporter subunit D [Rivibacter subsaxonicus]|uniref:Multisubunit potassium/proton antiporter PhaD subunit n=1 Tax=Rivibacter subsaxonicus TaxID=457575 RepID=A0A4Q7VA58_9BURK|nr:monovalent cation/H+ antiporter subunit D [Rivibacter subsaxonicus]RZT93646.1 multisubunit potassium/proton antiporter PhaD subunit [Rivibacter subsaxonicus]